MGGMLSLSLAVGGMPQAGDTCRRRPLAASRQLLVPGARRAFPGMKRTQFPAELRDTAAQGSPHPCAAAGPDLINGVGQAFFYHITVLQARRACGAAWELAFIKHQPPFARLRQRAASVGPRRSRVVAPCRRHVPPSVQGDHHPPHGQALPAPYAHKSFTLGGGAMSRPPPWSLPFCANTTRQLNSFFLHVHAWSQDICMSAERRCCCSGHRPCCPGHGPRWWRRRRRRPGGRAMPAAGGRHAAPSHPLAHPATAQPMDTPRTTAFSKTLLAAVGGQPCVALNCARFAYADPTVVYLQPSSKPASRGRGACAAPARFSPSPSMAGTHLPKPVPFCANPLCVNLDCTFSTLGTWVTVVPATSRRSPPRARQAREMECKCECF